MQEEISEKIRLFYVALTRAQEKIVIVLPEYEARKTPLNEDGVVSDAIRNNYKSFRDMMNSIKCFIGKAYHKIDLSKINLNQDYLNNNEEKKHIDTTGSTSFTVTNLTPEKVEIEESAHFSKSLHELINVSTRNNLKLGLKLHEALELIDFINPDLNLIEDEFIREKVNAFLHNGILKDLTNANIYKEYEFIYEKDNMSYHGIIDLMIEYDDHIDIIDYKTENIDDENYQKQLQGYKDYISTLTTKKINTYLYSILKEEVKTV
jgi:ATP-dependent helicase/nuclease subunit A